MYRKNIQAKTKKNLINTQISKPRYNALGIVIYRDM